MVFHISDISNSTKPWELCRHWTEILFTEFFNQGDFERERGYPITFLMDRSTVNIAKSQAGFYDFIMKPSLQAISLILNPQIQQNIANMENNR
jgi:3'5'-cyclic nucleotide phosphodiesterase